MPDNGKNRASEPRSVEQSDSYTHDKKGNLEAFNFGPTASHLLSALGGEVAEAVNYCAVPSNRFETPEGLADSRNNLVRRAIELWADPHSDELASFRRTRGESFELWVERRRIRLVRQDGSMPGASATLALGQICFPFALNECVGGSLVLSYVLGPSRSCRTVSLHELDADGMGELLRGNLWDRRDAPFGRESAKGRDETQPIDEFAPRMVHKPGDGEAEGS